MRAELTALWTNDSAERWPALPVLAVVAAASSWGVGSVLVKLTSLDGMAISFYRLWLGSLVMLVVLPLARTKMTWRMLRQAAPAGLIFGLNVALFFSAVKITTVANATLISALQPAIVLLFAGPIFGERIRSSQVFWTVLSIVGVGVVVVGAAGTPEWSPFGDALALGAVLLYTAYFIISKRVRSDMGTLEYLAAVQFVSALVVLPLGIISYEEVVSIHGRDWLYLAIFVVVTGLGGHMLVNWAHPYVDVSLSSLLVLLTPVVAAIGAWMALDESLTPLQIGGGLLTLAAIVALVRQSGAGAAAGDARSAEALAPEH